MIQDRNGGDEEVGEEENCLWYDTIICKIINMCIWVGECPRIALKDELKR